MTQTRPALQNRNDQSAAAAVSPPSAALPALSVEGVSHHYGARRALDSVSLTVEEGRFCALLGLNGAGKTTLFSLITRLFDTRRGQIKVFGYDVRTQSSQALRRIGVVFQSRTLDPELTVLENLLYHAALHGLSARDGRILAAQVLERVALADRERERVGNLSGGQMRRVEIARALVHRPKLLLLDEPTVGLDIGSRRDIAIQVRKLVAEGLGVLWATHLLEEVQLDDKIVVLHQGRVLANNVGGEILRQTRAPTLADAFNRLTGVASAEEEETIPNGKTAP